MDLPGNFMTNSPLKACIIGFGSIGARHYEVLKNLGLETAIVSRRNLATHEYNYQNIESALEEFNPNYLVIATETADHFPTLQKINRLNFKGKILIEKPAFDRPQRIELKPEIEVAVGYNLRFHPGISFLLDALKNEEIYSIQLSAGQWLPDWRSNRDFQSSYSSSTLLGGGVIRDLSHELDLALLFGGDGLSCIANFGHRSNLQIDTEDVADILLKSQKCTQINVHMDYLNKIPSRFLIIVGQNNSYALDMISGRLLMNNQLIQTYTLDRNTTYTLMHKAFLSSLGPQICSLEQGLKINMVIKAIETSGSTKSWVAIEQ